MTFAEIQKKFVAYYQNAGFQQLPRASMLHPSIPLSFVMSAGLVQAEEVLLHSQERSGNRFVLVQDCFRHFDLKAVGTDGIHLSLFEMPGAFMFGRDGHGELIARMWEFAVKSLRLDPQQIWISYFHGGTSNGQTLPKDETTYTAWQSLGIPEKRLIGMGLQDNYWIQGNGSHEANNELRKCGSCTEFFYDLGEERSCSPQCRPGCHCGRFVEFANSLFIFSSFDPKTNQFSPLDDPYGETVIGTERAAMLLQGAASVFATAEYLSLIQIIRDHATCENISDAAQKKYERVLADHLRALYVLIGEGAPPPGKNGRARIIKLLVRSIITRMSLLGIEETVFLSAVCKAVSDFFIRDSETAQQETESTLQQYIATERPQFERTVAVGRKELEKMLRENAGRSLSGAQLVFLEKQRGLPIVLAESLLKRRELFFSEEEYNNALRYWREQAMIKLNKQGASL
ncbi:MAG: hypothetical protein D3918_03195 [Candidatus Electrothrix sp. AX2]|nr:hypothetical protein [Candidatus Electrothrix gigas]